MVKNPPAMQEIQVQSLCGEDSPGEGNGIHSSIFAWRSPWTEELVGYSPWVAESDTTDRLSTVIKNKDSGSHVRIQTTYLLMICNNLNLYKLLNLSMPQFCHT